MEDVEKFSDHIVTRADLDCAAELADDVNLYDVLLSLAILLI